MNIIPKTRTERKLVGKLKKEARLKKLVDQWENTYTVKSMGLLFFRPCIYFLKHNNVVVYVGETKSLMNRITQHINEGSKIFDSFSFQVYQGSDFERKNEEARLISAIKPRYNIVHNSTAFKPIGISELEVSVNIK